MHYKHEAERLFEAGDMKGCLKAYLRFEDFSGRYSVYDRLRSARCHARMNDPSACIFQLIAGVEKGLWYEHDKPELDISAYEEFIRVWLDTSQQQAFEQARQKYLAGLDTVLISKIEEMHAADQAVRSKRAGDAEIRKVDSLNLIGVFSIIRSSNGFPSASRINPKARFGLTLLIQHAIRTFPSTFDTLSQVMIEAAHRYDVSPTEFAAMRDRQQYDLDGHTVFGEVPFRDDAGRLSVANVADPSQVDDLRFAIGLVPLAEHAAEREALLPEGYQRRLVPCP